MTTTPASASRPPRSRRAPRPVRRGPDIALRDVRADEWEAVRDIFREYAASLRIDLCFQGFEAELAGLPGDYSAPSGALLLGWVDGRLAACGAVRALPEVDHANACEMKRLYVRPAFRGLGLGRSIAQALMERASAAGYSSMLLDTLDDMQTARGLYASLGFEEVPAYYYNPIPGAHYLKATL